MYPGDKYDPNNYNEPAGYTPTQSDVLQNGMSWASGGIRRAQELRDPNSAFNKMVLSQIRTSARSAGPSVNELMQLQRGLGGLSGGGSITMAGEQARQQETRARQSAGQSFLTHLLNNEQSAVANQGQALSWNAAIYGDQNQASMLQKQLDDQYSFGGFMNQMLGLGGSLLGKWAAGNGE